MKEEQILEIAEVISNAINAKTRAEIYDFLYSTSFKSDGSSLQEMMALANDNEIQESVAIETARYIASEFIK